MLLACTLHLRHLQFAPVLPARLHMLILYLRHGREQHRVAAEQGNTQTSEHACMPPVTVAINTSRGVSCMPMQRWVLLQLLCTALLVGSHGPAFLPLRG